MTNTPLFKFSVLIEEMFWEYESCKVSEYGCSRNDVRIQLILFLHIYIYISDMLIRQLSWNIL